MHLTFCSAAMVLCAMLVFAGNGIPIYIFKPWQWSDISEIKTEEVPWTYFYVAPPIVAFRDNVLKGLMADPQVKKIWNSAPDSATIRRIYFNRMNRLFTEKSNNAVPAALANIISKAASLFDKLDKKTYFESDAVSIGQYLTSKGIGEVNAAGAQGYVGNISKAIEVGDISTPEAEFEALIAGRENFLLAYGLRVHNFQPELPLLFTSHLINLFDK